MTESKERWAVLGIPKTGGVVELHSDWPTKEAAEAASKRAARLYPNDRFTVNAVVETPK